MNMKDKIVVVTGGAQNIGLAISMSFLKAGATVIVADVNAPDTSYERLYFHKTNITDEADVANLMAMVKDKYGHLDVLVNNAGICIEVALHEMSVEEWDKVMNVNVKGVFLMTKHAFELLSAPTASNPAIVNISSIEGIGANPLHSVYAASKGAVTSFTKNTALEYGPHGIRCNAIAPGWVNTPFNEELLNQYPDRKAVDAEIEALHPLGKLGLPKDIGETALFLASDAAAFINGQQIIVDGARTSKLPLPKL